MDSATHLVMGAGIAGLATLDPAFNEPGTHAAIWLGAMAGSVIPDIDTVMKLKDNATYIRHHRGVTHSIPATLLWPFVLTLVIGWMFSEANMLHLLLWTALGVFIHVFSDIFNAYGTQALRPVRNKWIALDMINIFDPLIFSLHIAGFIIWKAAGHAGITFLLIYAIIIVYYIARGIYKLKVKQAVREQLADAADIFLSPTLRWSQYHLAVRGEDYMYVGEVKSCDITIFERMTKKEVPDTPLIEKAKEDPNIASFLSFSPIFDLNIYSRRGYKEVRFMDLRYYSNGRYPFVAIAHIDEDLNIISSFTGWVYSEDKLQKKLAAPDRNLPVS